MPKITEAVREERRQRFIDAAWRCAARKGYRDMTVDDVCEEVGASKGAFYGYFDSKQALLHALLADDAASVDVLTDGLDTRAITAVERIRRFTKAMLERGADQGRVQVRADLWAASITEPGISEHLAEMISHRRMQLRGWIQDAVENNEIHLGGAPPNAFASLLLALGDGLMLHHAIDPSGFRWQNIARVLDEIFAALAEK